MCLNKYNCTVLMNPSLRLYLYQCFNIAYSMTLTMILKLVHNLLYPSISYCAHVKKKMLAVGGLCPSKTLGLATPLHVHQALSFIMFILFYTDHVYSFL